MGATQPDVRDDPSGGRALERQALEFFARWGESFDAFAASFELLAEDCVWDQRPIPQLVGPRAAVRFLMLARRTLGVETCDVEIVRVASEGSVVHVERVDRLRRADGSLIVAAPVAGVLTFSGGRVIHWREYFDSAEFVAQALTTGAAHLASRCAAVLVAGRVVKRGGALVGVDLPALRARLLDSRNRIAAAAGVPLDGTWLPSTEAE